MMHFLKAAFPALILLLIAGAAPAQDIHFSHMHRTPLHLNPALTGMAPSDLRFGGIYRNQWRAVPVPYTTFGAFADTRLSQPKLGPGFIGAGLQLLTDEAGDGQMRWVQGAISLSYLVPIGNQFALGAGIQGSFAQRNFELGLLTFDEQFDGDQFNAASANGEDARQNTLNYISFAAGANIRFKVPESRTQFDLGSGVHHLTAPVSSFLEDEDIRLSPRISPYLLGSVQVHSKIDVLLRAWWQGQGSYRELVTGAGILYHLQTARQRELSLEFSILNRWKDALIPQFGLRYRTWEAGMSYDINFSDFQKATGRRGGPELYFQYFITRVQPPPLFKACPIF